MPDTITIQIDSYASTTETLILMLRQDAVALNASGYVLTETATAGEFEAKHPDPKAYR